MLLQILFASLLHFGSGTPAQTQWALTYEIKFKDSDVSLTQYVVINDEYITSITWRPDILESIVCQVYRTDESCTMSVINHMAELCFHQHYTWQEYLASLHLYEPVRKKGGSIEFVDTDQTVIFTAELSDKIPNAFPMLMHYENIKYAPVRLDYDDKTVSLIDYTIDENRIAEMLNLAETIGYHVLDQKELNARSKEIMGSKVEGMKEIIEEIVIGAKH